MPKIVKNGKEYSGVPIECVTAWQPTGDPVQVAEPLMGNTDISDIGDGTITGAISAVNAGLITISDPITVSVGTVAAGGAYLIAYVSNLIPAGKTFLGGILVSSGGSTALIGGSIVANGNNLYFVAMSAQAATTVIYRVLYV